MAPAMDDARYSRDAILSLLGTKRFGRGLRFFATVESTQRVARDLAEAGCPEGTAVVADEQTAGVGRMGRVWHSARGLGIWLSLVLRPPIRPSECGLMSAWAGLAVLKALNPAGWGDAGAGLKWPNDVVVGGRKLCGILTDTKSAAEEMAYAVVGIGLNVNHGHGDFPAEIASTATSIKIVGGEIADRAVLLARVLREMERTYPLMLSEGGRRSIADDAQRASVLIGSRVTVDGPGGILRGIPLRIEADGGLVVAEVATGREKKVVAGDVEFLKVREAES